jgi:hypothetical protein
MASGFPPALSAANVDSTAAAMRLEAEQKLYTAACLQGMPQEQILRRQAAHDILDVLYDALERQQRILRDLYHGK